MPPDDFAPENERGRAASVLRPEVVFLVASSLFIIGFWIWFLFLRAPTDGVEKEVIQGKATSEILAACNAAAAAAGLTLLEADLPIFEEAFELTQRWLGVAVDETKDDDFEVLVYKDFSLDIESDKAPDFLINLFNANRILGGYDILAGILVVVAEPILSFKYVIPRCGRFL